MTMNCNELQEIARNNNELADILAETWYNN